MCKLKEFSFQCRNTNIKYQVSKLCNYKCDDISTSKVSERLQSLTSICGLHRDIELQALDMLYIISSISIFDLITCLFNFFVLYH